MIQTFADILQAFIAEEAEKLAVYEIKHAPTIGAMYEGLSSKLLEQTVPEGLGLQVASGFVVGLDGSMSGQIDCMLVLGVGEDIPHTNLKKWPVWNVLAVFEVKKTIHAAELRDSFFTWALSMKPSIAGSTGAGSRSEIST